MCHVHPSVFFRCLYAALRVGGGTPRRRQDTPNKSPEPTYRAKQAFKLAFTSTDNLEMPIHVFGP